MRARRRPRWPKRSYIARAPGSLSTRYASAISSNSDARLLVPEVDVRRVLPREPPVRLTDLARRRRRRDAQHCVVIAPHDASLLLLAQVLELGVHDLALLARPAERPAARRAGAGARPACWPCASRYMTSASLCAARVSVSCARFIRSMSSPLSASRASASASSTALRSPSASLAPCSPSVRSVEYTSESVWLRTSISSFALRVLGRVRLGLLHHPLDLVLGQAGRGGDGDVLLLARRLVLGRRRSGCRWRRCRTSPRSAARRAAPAGCRPGGTCRACGCRAPSGRSPCSTCTSTDVWLSAAVVKISALLRRDRRVALDQRGHHAAQRLDAERQRGDVERAACP